MAHNHPTSTTTNPTIHITILTIEILLIFSVLILIIGPSRILSESSSTSCTCPQIHIDISNPQPSSSPSSPSHHDGIHQRIYNTSAALEATAKSPANPFTWEEILTPPVITYGIRIQKESLNHLDDDPDIEAEAEPAEGGHHGHSHSPGHSSDEIGFVISLEHQLHCLTAIRGLIFPNNTNTSLNSSNTPWQEKTMELNYGHWSHCFDYLAQVSSTLHSLPPQPPPPPPPHPFFILLRDTIWLVS